MTDATENSAKGANAPSGERRQVTVLFADMAGFTAISERLGEEGTYTLIQPIYELMAGAVKEQGGSVREFTGDGVMALFGVPNALEDAPLRACRAAVAIQERVAAASPTIEAKHGVHPRMRIGINTGLAVVTQIRGEGANMTALGDTVNLASRLQTLAEPGKVLLSEATYRQVQGLVDTTFAGEHEIKGKSERQKAYRLEAVHQGAARFDAAVSRGLTDYVGRDRELDLLERDLADARIGLRVVDVMAEPGMGKSRLLHEFRQRVGKDRAFVLTGNCSPDSKQTPFLPFIEIVRGSFRIRAGEAEKDVGLKLVAGLTSLGLYTPQNLGLLLNLLGLKPPEGSLTGLDGVLIGLRTRELFQNLLATRCGLSPVVMLVEDLHWIDSVSEELLGKIVEGGKSLPLLVIVTRRPEYVPSWLDRPDVTRLTLTPLPADEIGQLVRSRLGVAQLPSELTKLIADRAEGNALFAEEIVSFLTERGVLRPGLAQLDYDAAAVAAAMPASVQGLLTSRVDRLAPEDRALLQAASVIGRRFSPELLDAIIAGSGNAVARLDAMGALDLVYPDGRSGDYAFKHALVRDALYQSLLTAPRTALHLRSAEEIERRSGNRLAEVAEALAHHYSQTERDDKAFTYLAMAGAKSLGTYSLEEAETHLAAALALLGKNSNCANDEKVAAFAVNYTLLCNLANKPAQIIAAADALLPRLEKAGELKSVVLVRHQEVFALIHQGRFRDAAMAQSRASRIAEDLADRLTTAYSLAGEILLYALIGNKSSEAFEKTCAEALTAAKTGDPYIQIWTPAMVGWAEFHRGRIAHARESGEKLLEIGERLSDPRSAGLGCAILAWAAIAGDDYGKALEYCDAGLRVAITPFDRDGCLNARATALVLLRRPDSLQNIENWVHHCKINNWQWYLSGTEACLGLAWVMQGQLARGLAQVEGVIGRSRERGYNVVADWVGLFICEVYLEVLAGKEKPPFAVLMKSLPKILKIVLTASHTIPILTKRVLDNPQFDPDGHFIGRSEMILGLLYKTKNKRDLAIRHLTEARRITIQFGQTPMLARIETALAELAR